MELREEAGARRARPRAEHKRALIEGVLEGTGVAAALDVDALLALVRHTRRSARDDDFVQEIADGDDPT